LPEPTLPLAEQAWGIVVAGIGGTGVITIGQLLGMAAHLEGKGVITQDSAGLAQKGGATWSHIQIANRPEAIHTTKVDTAKADLVIACDGIVAAGKSTLSLMREGRTYVALNSHATPTAAFVGNPDWQNPTGGCEAALLAAVGATKLGLLDADTVAVQLLGDSIYANPLLLGYAWQQGQVPVSRAALLRAMELNGVQIDNNKAAFEWGRRCAHDLAAVTALFKTAQVIEFVKKPSLDEMIGKRVEFLTGYQDADYAGQYRAFVAKVRAAEAPQGGGGSTRLTEAVARYLFKLMAYKDEYEVARLHSEDRWHVRRRLQGRAPPGAAVDCQAQCQGRTGQATVRTVDAQGVRRARKAEEPARHAVGRLRPHRGAQERASADRPIPGLHRRTAACRSGRRRAAEPGGRNCAHP